MSRTAQSHPVNPSDEPIEAANAGGFAPRTLIVTNGNQGSDAQAQGLVQALGLTNVETAHVKLKGWAGFTAPNGGVPGGQVGAKGKLFHPPWPDMVISVGRHAAPYAMAIRRKSKGQTFTVALQNPQTKPDKWDLIWAPQHDEMDAPNVVATLTSPHRLTADRLRQAADAMAREIAGMPRPWVAVLVGGPNGKYHFGGAATRRLCAELDALAPGGSFLITTSRRTTHKISWTLQQWIGDKPARLWMGGANNPLLGFIGVADAIVVTADSVNMAGEAATTGKPIYVFDLSGKAKKFRRFHEALAATGATRPLSGQRFEPWTYAPVDPNPVIARAVREAYLAWDKQRGA